MLKASTRLGFGSVLLLGLLVNEHPVSAQDTTAMIRQVERGNDAALRCVATQQLAAYYHDKQQNERGIYWLSQGLDLASGLTNDSLQFAQYNMLSSLQDEEGNSEDALSTLQNYVALQKGESKEQLAEAYNNIGVLYGAMNDAVQQTAYYIKAQQMHESLGNQEAAKEIEANLAYVYLAEGSYEKAITTLRPLLVFFKQHGRYSSLFHAYGNLAAGFAKTKAFDSAFHYSDLQLALARQNGAPKLQFDAWAKRSGLCSSTGKMAEFKMANDSMLFYAQQSNSPSTEALSYSNLGMYYAVVEHNSQKALDYFQKTLAINRKLGDKRFTVSTINNLAATYEQMGDFENAYKMMEKAFQLKDSVVTDAGQAKVAELQTRFQTEKKEARIRLLNEQNRLQKRASIFLVIGLVLLALLGIILYRLYRLKHKTNKELAQLNDALVQANQTKAKLFSIISHDLRSPISQVYQFLKLQQSKPGLLDAAQQQKLSGEIQTATGSLLETMEELLGWSKTQLNQFTSSLQPVDLAEILDESLQLLQLSAAAKQLRLDQQVHSQVILKTDPYFLQTIVRNLVQNAIKASPQAGIITITYAAPVLSIENEGGYFSQAQFADAIANAGREVSLSGLGLQLVSELSAQLNIEVFFAETAGRTTRATLRFPS